MFFTSFTVSVLAINKAIVVGIKWKCVARQATEAKYMRLNMVYCRLISVNNGVAKYSIGSLIDDITGILVVDSNEETYSIEKQPDKRELYMRHVGAMMCKNKDVLSQGIFPEKMSYEI